MCFLTITSHRLIIDNNVISRYLAVFSFSISTAYKEKKEKRNEINAQMLKENKIIYEKKNKIIISGMNPSLPFFTFFTSSTF